MRTFPLYLKWGLVFLLIILVLFLIFYKPAGARARDFAIASTSWVLGPVHRIGSLFSKGWDSLKERARAYSENQQLRAREALLLVDKTEFENLRQENEEMRKALEIKKDLKRNTTYSEVLGNFSEGRDEYLIISQNDASSIHEGSPVLSPEGIFVGVVRTAGDTSATVRLLASPTETMTVRLSPAGIEGVATGNNNGEYLISLIPENANVSIGDVAISAGRNENIPGGIAVGDVVSIEHESGGFLKIVVRSPQNANLLDHVSVLLD